MNLGLGLLQVTSYFFIVTIILLAPSKLTTQAFIRSNYDGASSSFGRGRGQGRGMRGQTDSSGRRNSTRGRGNSQKASSYYGKMRHFVDVAIRSMAIHLELGL